MKIKDIYFEPKSAIIKQFAQDNGWVYINLPLSPPIPPNEFLEKLDQSKENLDKKQ